MTRTFLLWVLWSFITVLVAGTAMARLYVAGDRTVLLPGQTAGVHHQIEIACDTCHTSSPFASVGKVRKDLNKTCVECHKDELKAANDSHPIKKFKNPRKAAYWEKVDARFCTTCHEEHRPEVTLAGMVTLPGDYCVACHSEGEQDVRVDRPSHAGLSFDTCATAGCHNFHDNKALYEDFLVKNAGQEWLAENPTHALAATRRQPRSGNAPDPTALKPLILAPISGRSEELVSRWAASGHATGEVGCAACHAPEAKTLAEAETNWLNRPAEEVCASCHKAERKSFSIGRHGMRRHPDTAKPRTVQKALKGFGWKDPPETLVAMFETLLQDPAPPATMTTDEARVALHGDAVGRELTCNTCHDPHAQNLAEAAVGACLSCHDDGHSRAYKSSPHFALWEQELAGSLQPGQGVTCATCHMPKEETSKGIVTNHNQNDTLRPNEKMIRPVCMECHGLAFAIDALADPDLIANNFTGKPVRHIESIDWAVNRVNQPGTGANQ
ncbi:cytochrome c3 family protein [Hwanghaeella sp.]|uniref:cytochrome c3 family protein n=1 Tax=Hwanghaeella sp. TaxID=2605943 RepID=UPI003CCBE9BD